MQTPRPVWERHYIRRDLVEQAPIVAIFQIAIFFIFITTLERSGFHPQLVTPLGGLVVLSNVARMSLAGRLGKRVTLQGRKWRYSLEAAILSSALGWGLLLATVIFEAGYSSTAGAIALICLAGISSTSVLFLYPHPSLARANAALLMAFPSIALLVNVNGVRAAIVVGMAIFLIYLLAEVALQSRRYRQNLLTRRRLALESDKLRVIIDAIPGLVSWLGADLRYRGVSRSLADLYGRKPEEFVGQRVGFQNSHSVFTQAVESFVRSDSEQKAIEMRLPVIDQERWHLVVMRKTPMKEAYIISIDIHETKEAQRELEQQRVRAEFTSKMATIGEMASGVAHEINGPLGEILSHVGRMRQLAAQGDGEMEESLGKIDTASERIGGIVRSLRDFSADSSSRAPETAPVSRIIEDALVFCREKFGMNSVNLQANIPSEEILLTCRPTQISQVILALLHNSFEAVSLLSERWIRLDVSDQGETVRLSVTDSGGGIPEAVRSRMFEPSFSTKGISFGSGLGLSVSLGIVRAHGGMVVYDSSSGHTCFVVTLPKVMMAQQLPLPQGPIAN